MSHTFAQLFYLKGKHFEKHVKVPIYLRLTVNGQRSELSISRKVHPEKWNAKMGRMRGAGQEATELNRYLDMVRAKINKIHHEFIEEGKPFSAKDIKESYLGRGKDVKMLLAIYEEHNAQMKQLVGTEFAMSTWKRYHTSKKHLLEFIQTEYKREDIPVQEVSLKFIKRFEYFLKFNKACNHNSTLKYINNFKKIIRMAVANDWITKDPFYNYKAKFKWKEREFLTKDEIQALQSKPLHAPRLDLVRDTFVFCCYTGLAYADVKKLKRDDIVLGIDGGQWIKVNRTKTESRSSIPLLPTVQAILEKYETHPHVANGKCLIPVLSNQKSNAYLKEIADLCGIPKNLTTHLARHTFATTVTLANGVPIETVSRMLGHKSLRATQHYAKVIDRKVSEDMAILKEKLFTNKDKNIKVQ